MQNGFVFLRQKGNHKIYFNGTIRQVLPHHAGEILHPKIVKEVLKILNNKTLKMFRPEAKPASFVALVIATSRGKVFKFRAYNI